MLKVERGSTPELKFCAQEHHLGGKLYQYSLRSWFPKSSLKLEFRMFQLSDCLPELLAPFCNLTVQVFFLCFLQ